jgi:hypothetical protein
MKTASSLKISKQGVCHTVALPFTLKKSILRQKRRMMETQTFHHVKIYSSSKKSSK